MPINVHKIGIVCMTCCVQTHVEFKKGHIISLLLHKTSSGCPRLTQKWTAIKIGFFNLFKLMILCNRQGNFMTSGLSNRKLCLRAMPKR